MAKGKNATALFDVIHAAKKPPKSSPSAAMPTPRWWAKDKKKLTAANVPPIGETAGKQTSWLAAVKKTSGAVPAAQTPVVTVAEGSVETPFEQDSRPVQPDHQQAAAVETVAESAMESAVETPVHLSATIEESPVRADPPVTSVRWMPRAQPAAMARPALAAEPVAETSAESVESDETPPLVAEVKTRFADRVKRGGDRPEQAEPPVAAVDRDAREVSFRFSYAGLIGLGLIVVLAMTLAFIIGNRVSNLRSDAGKSKTQTATSGTPASGTSSGGALLSAVGPTRPAPLPSVTPPFRPSVTDVGPKPSASSTKPTVTSTPTARTAAPGAAKPPIDDPRVAGRSYIVIRTYSSTDGDAAKKTCDLLTANGIPCSVVRGLKNYVPRGWYCVVGYQPFTSVTSADCAAYCKQLDALRAKFAGRMQQRRDSELYLWSLDAEQN